MASNQERMAISPKKTLSLFKNRVNLFYFLALIPLIALTYFSWLRAVIPLYAFILLLLKKDKLFSHSEPDLMQRAIGILVLFLSLFAYYGIALVLPTFADPYGIPNYVIHLIGLFLVFFDLSALKEAFTPIFLIVATASSYFLSESLSGPLSPVLVPLFMNIIVTTLQLIRLPLTVVGSSNIIILHTPKGNVATQFVWGCIGIYSTIVFSIILVIVLLEEKSPLRTKLLWSTIGVFGTNIVNIIRVIIIYLTDYYAGAEVGAQVHFFIGYMLFMAWLALFFYVMAKRPFRKKTDKAKLGKTEDG